MYLAVVDADRVEQERLPPAAAHALLDIIADRLEMDVPRDDVDVAVADRDEGLVPVHTPTPVARSRLRWVVRASPRLIMSERMVRLSRGMHDGMSLDPS